MRERVPQLRREVKQAAFNDLQVLCMLCVYMLSVAYVCVSCQPRKTQVTLPQRLHDGQAFLTDIRDRATNIGKLAMNQNLLNSTATNASTQVSRSVLCFERG